MKNQAILLLVSFAFVLVLSAYNQGPTDYFSSSDADSLVKMVLAKKDKGIFQNNIGDTHYAVKIIKQLKGTYDDKTVCDFAVKGLKGDIESIYHSAQVIQTAGCSLKIAPEETAQTINKALQSDSLLDYYHAVTSYFSLGKPASVSGDSIRSVVHKLIDLQDEDQETFKRTPTQKEGSIFYTGLAFTALSKLYGLASPDDQGLINGVLENIPNLLSLSEADDDTLHFSHQDNTISRLRTTYAIVQGILDLSEALGAGAQFDAEKVIQLANYFVQQKYTNSISEAHAFLFGLLACNHYPQLKPVVLSLVRGSIQTSAKGEEGHVKVRVTDVFGQAVPTTSVFLIRASHQNASSDLTILSNQELKATSDPTVFSLNFLATKPEPRLYVMNFRVTPKNSTQTIEAVRSIKVVASIKVEDVVLVVSDRYEDDSTETKKFALEYNQKLPEVVRVESDQSLVLSFKIKSVVSNRAIAVHQASVRFTHLLTGEDVYFNVKPSLSRSYKFSVILEKTSHLFHNRSGEYRISLIIGDAFIDNSFEWDLGSVFLSVEGEQVPVKPTRGPKPPINHLFRQPAPRPPMEVSIAFTFAVLAPILVLLIGFVILGTVNLSNFPSGVNAVFATGFILSLVGIIFVYYLYWVKLNLFQALSYVGILSIPVVFFGNRTLKFLALKRISSEKTHTD